MKKILLLVVALFVSAGISHAQFIKGPSDNSITEIQAGETLEPTDSNAQYLNYQYLELLNRQNDILNSRRTALILTLAGGFAGSICASAIQNGNNSVGLAYGYIGAVLTELTGLVWLTVNEFTLINNRKKINENIKLRYTGNGVALQF